MFLTITLFLIGALAAATALWFLDSGSLTYALGSMGAFFILSLWAFIRLLQWRDQRRAQLHSQGPVAPKPGMEGTLYGLVPGAEYRVIQDFTDYYGNSFKQGETLRFTTRHFLPYHGGHTLVFGEKQIFLQEDQNKNILDNFKDYIERIPPQ
ncbi:MAG: hypothetical protein Fur0017_08730 [Anaerolineales bacterium]